MTNCEPSILMETFGICSEPFTQVSNICLVYWKNFCDFFALANMCGSSMGLSLYANIMCLWYGFDLSM